MFLFDYFDEDGFGVGDFHIILTIFWTPSSLFFRLKAVTKRVKSRYNSSEADIVSNCRAFVSSIVGVDNGSTRNNRILCLWDDPTI